jgi:glycosyl transferase family 25
MISSFFYINLDRRVDRLQNIQKEIKKSNILSKNIKKYQAIDGQNIDLEKLSNFIITKRGSDLVREKKILHYGVTLTYGSLGCAVSHYNLFKYCAEKNNGSILILEDDIKIDYDIDKYIQIVDQTKEYYDIFYLGFHRSRHTKTTPTDNSDILKLSGYFWGGFAYILTPKACKYIINNVFPISQQFDSEINKQARLGKLACLTFNTNIVKMGSFTSDNQGKYGLKHNGNNKNKEKDIWLDLF